MIYYTVMFHWSVCVLTPGGLHAGGGRRDRPRPVQRGQRPAAVPAADGRGDGEPGPAARRPAGQVPQSRLAGPSLAGAVRQTHARPQHQAAESADAGKQSDEEAALSERRDRAARAAAGAEDGRAAPADGARGALRRAELHPLRHRGQEQGAEGAAGEAPQAPGHHHCQGPRGHPKGARPRVPQDQGGLREEQAPAIPDRAPAGHHQLPAGPLRAGPPGGAAGAPELDTSHEPRAGHVRTTRAEDTRGEERTRQYPQRSLADPRGSAESQRQAV